MEFIRSSLIKGRTAATETLSVDLPTNPLSHLIITLAGYNVTDETTLAEVLGFINKITITQYGRTVMDLESEDLYGLNCYLFKRRPVLYGKIATDNQMRALSLIVPFGRKIYNPSECFPGTKKGEITLQLNYTAPTTSLDNGVIDIEAVELPGATPEQYLKSTLLTVSAPGATGPNDIELPIGNDIIAIQQRMTTFPAASSHVFGIDESKILVDNKEYGFVGNKAVSLLGDLINIVDSQHGTIAAQGSIEPLNIVYLDFDPVRNNEFLLKTSGKSSVKLRAEMGVDEASYISIFELVNTRG